MKTARELLDDETGEGRRARINVTAGMFGVDSDDFYALLNLVANRARAEMRDLAVSQCRMVADVAHNYQLGDEVRAADRCAKAVAEIKLDGKP